MQVQPETIEMDQQQTRQVLDDNNDGGGGLCSCLCVFLSLIWVVLTFPISLPLMFKCPQEYQRAVVYRLGKLKSRKPYGPGVVTVVPCADSAVIVDMRVQSFDVPPQEILSKDGVTVTVDAVVYYRVVDAVSAVNNVQDYGVAARTLAATSLRNALGTKTLSEMLTERQTISAIIAEMLESATSSWGVDVQRVEITDVKLPPQMQKSMAAEAEAQREARAKVIQADGELRAARALKEAADVMQGSPGTMQLRYLQTLGEVAQTNSTTIIFPIPIELLKFGGAPHQMTNI